MFWKKLILAVQDNLSAEKNVFFDDFCSKMREFNQKFNQPSYNFGRVYRNMNSHLKGMFDFFL